ncbi:ATP-binding protein [Janthinobacterium sp. GW460P]|uniref:ATP-binding protein n=1 Tax=unclassified Janthinobacterium TaxID=2610881 RepID=UPI000A31FFA8|nr:MULTISPECIES: ATP-binding protein [unclassified Janthinobacterium]MCC7703517.1 ATP-binding protein [Janthinobacterium sp. GW460P]MCC7709024.1 ATP-binding protein [Janthinobacterium sp. GW460W]
MSSNSFSPSYIDQNIAEYRDNPLIEALPPILSEKAAAKAMLLRPSFQPEERNLPTEERWHLLARLKHVVVPRMIFYDVERTISRLIRSAYVVRSPLAAGTWRTVYAAQDSAQLMKIDPQLISSESQMLMVGLSGSGKTTCADAILRTYPQQVIHHSVWHGRQVPITQLVWLKVTCPKNGSISSFCREFARQVDLALKTDGKYEKLFSKSKLTEDMLEGSMRQIAATHFLGILIIDEIQRLSLAKTGGTAPLLHFFQDLRTMLRVPVVEIGTNKAAKLFTAEMKDGRRASESGLIQFERPSKRVKEWDDFVRRIWTYQWIRNPQEPDEKMLDTVFDLSQSIPDFIVLLFKLAQQRAMLDGTESLTPALLRHTYDESLTLLHPPINALRENTVKSLSQYEDLLPVEEALLKLLELPKHITVVDDYMEKLFPTAIPSNSQTMPPVGGVGDTVTVDANDDGQPVAPAITVQPPDYVDMRSVANADDPYQELVDKEVISNDLLNFESRAR